MNEHILILALVIGGLATLNFLIYSIFSRWWETWSGRAYWSLFFSLILFSVHFILEGDDPLKQDDGRELAVSYLLIASLAFNLGVMIYKRFFWTPAHDVARDARRARRIAGRAA